MKMGEKLEKMSRDALEAEPPKAADDRILAAIRSCAASRRRKRTFRVLAAAAALAAMLCGGAWLHVRQRVSAEQGDVSMADEGEIMLEIIDMAEPMDFEPFQVARL